MNNSDLLKYILLQIERAEIIIYKIGKNKYCFSLVSVLREVIGISLKLLIATCKWLSVVITHLERVRLLTSEMEQKEASN